MEKNYRKKVVVNQTNIFKWMEGTIFREIAKKKHNLFMAIPKMKNEIKGGIIKKKIVHRYRKKESMKKTKKQYLVSRLKTSQKKHK